jgi:hypothetical protein
MRDYEFAMADQPLPLGAGKVRPGTMTALAISYFASPEFRTLRSSTQRAYRGMIDQICRDHGDKRAADMRREHVVKLMAVRAEQPGAANGLRMALRVMMKHAVAIGLRADDPTRDVRAIRVKTDGHHSWTDNEIERPTPGIREQANHGRVRALPGAAPPSGGRPARPWAWNSTPVAQLQQLVIEDL